MPGAARQSTPAPPCLMLRTHHPHRSPLTLVDCRAPFYLTSLVKACDGRCDDLKKLRQEFAALTAAAEEDSEKARKTAKEMGDQLMESENGWGAEASWGQRYDHDQTGPLTRHTRRTHHQTGPLTRHLHQSSPSQLDAKDAEIKRLQELLAQAQVG
jgi:hypothetical protein